jgi:hypothetical protein
MVRDGAGNVPNQTFSELPTRFRLESFLGRRSQLVRHGGAAIGDHLGQTANLLVGQAVNSGSRPRGLDGLRNRFAGHALLLKALRARLPAANRTVRFTC